MAEAAVLSPDIMKSIVPFSGTKEEMSPGELVMAQGGAIQKIQTGYATAVAVQKPRSITRVVDNVLAEAKLAGASFYYRWEVFDKKLGRKVPIQGPSIDLAMCIARNYGNCAVPISVNETLTHYIFKSDFVDLETGFTVERLFRQRKSQSLSDKMDRDRQEDIVFQIGQSKAQRNAVCKASPAWLIEQAIEVARQAEIDKIKPENIVIARVNALGFFGRYDVSQEQIERYIDKPVDAWTASDIADLKGVATGIKEGRISVTELFAQPESASDKPGGTTQEAPPPPGNHDTTEPGHKENGNGNPNAGETTSPSSIAKTYFQEHFFGLRNTFEAKLLSHIQSGKIKEATAEDLVELRKKWADNKTTKDRPFPLDKLQEQNEQTDKGDGPPLQNRPEDALGVKVVCPENSPSAGDTLNLGYCRRICSWPEKNEQCESYSKAEGRELEQF